MANKAKKQNTEGKPNPNKGKKRGPITSFKDIVMTVTLEGADGVNTLRTAGKLAKRPLKGAIDYLREKESHREAGILESIFSDMYPNSSGERGREAPKVGESRTYKAQQTFEGRKLKKEKNAEGKMITTVISEGEPKGSPWLRLPLGSLGVEHGGNVNVDFKDGSIVVTPL